MVCLSILFCFAILSFGLFSKSRTGQGSKNGWGGGVGLGQLTQKTRLLCKHVFFRFILAKATPNCNKRPQNYEQLKIGTIFVHEAPCFLHETPFLLMGFISLNARLHLNICEVK